MDNLYFPGIHFTHGHLSGKDVKYDPLTDAFTILANLYWSYRPLYYEFSFPIWVDIMNLAEAEISPEKLFGRIDAWGIQWRTGIFDVDPTSAPQYWFNLLNFAMNTIMLDLGASEWKAGDAPRKQALLNAWKGLFDWLIKNNFNFAIAPKIWGQA